MDGIDIGDNGDIGLGNSSQVSYLSGVVAAELGDNDVVVRVSGKQCQRQAYIVIEIFRRLKNAVMLT